MTGAPPSRIADKIVWARKRKGISQERLAELIGTSRRHMIRIEKGHQMPGAEFRRRICEATDQDASFLEEPAAEDDSEAAPVGSMSLDEFLHQRVRREVRQAVAELAREEMTA